MKTKYADYYAACSIFVLCLLLIAAGSNNQPKTGDVQIDNSQVVPMMQLRIQTDEARITDLEQKLDALSCPKPLHAP
jgi:hypothetical protein